MRARRKLSSAFFFIDVLVLSPRTFDDHAANAKPPALLLANELVPKIDPAKYLVSEKYDGVRVLEGKVFVIGTGFTDVVRRKAAPVVAKITYTYRGLTSSGLPRFASYLRVREEF